MARLVGDIARFRRAAARLEAEMFQAFERAMRIAKGQIDVDALTAALEAGNVLEAARLAQITPAALAPMTGAIQSTFVAGGETIAAGIPIKAGVLGFDGRAVRAEQWAREHSALFVKQITDDHTMMVRDVTEKLLADNVDPRKAALDLVGRLNRATGKREGGFIGLTQKQAQHVFNAGQQLRDLDPAYFQRKLRDKRFDSLVQRAIAEGRPIPASKIAQIEQAYRTKYERYRGEMIARTETLNALRAGRHEGLTQAGEQGIIRPDRIATQWDATLDRRTRPDHALMHGQISHGESDPFRLPDGSLMRFPGDSALGAHASQIIQCRCYARPVIDYLKA